MKRIIISLLLITVVFPVFAQRNRNVDREKLEAARVAFITNRLSLSPQQAEKFWPLFNQHQESRDQLMGKLRDISRKGDAEISGDQAKQLIEERYAIQKKMLEIEKAFIDKVSASLSPVQALKLNEANRDFTRHIYRMQRRGSRSSEDNN